MNEMTGKDQEIVKETLRDLSKNVDMLSAIIEFFPYPIQVYTPDGTMALTNQACMKLMHFQSPDQVVGKFNVLRDPVIDEWGDGVREKIARSFTGETVQFENLRMPTQEIIERFEADTLSLDTRYMNITCFPIFDDRSQLAYVVHLFVTARVYDGKAEMVKAKEYIESHWLEEFDLDAAARSVHLSRHHFSRIFKRYTSFTPFGYYQEIKLGKLKEKLLDENLSITEAFSACGLAYSGNYARLFREKVGMTPSQYRKSILQK